MGVARDHRRFSKRVTHTARWKVLRMAVLERDSFACQSCGARGRLEVDHVKPVRTHPELSFDLANLQSLCPSCHTRKTRLECGHPDAHPEADRWRAAVRDLERGRPGWSIPTNLSPSGVTVTIVCGPPAAGKTTYVQREAAPGDVVIDLDAFLQQVGARPWERDADKVKAAFRLRDQAIRDLSKLVRGQAWLIVSAPSSAERAEWKRRLRRVTFEILATDPDTCKARILADPDRQHASQAMLTAVDRWWSIFAAEGGTPSNQGTKSDA